MPALRKTLTALAAVGLIGMPHAGAQQQYQYEGGIFFNHGTAHTQEGRTGKTGATSSKKPKEIVVVGPSSSSRRKPKEIVVVPTSSPWKPQPKRLDGTIIQLGPDLNTPPNNAQDRLKSSGPTGQSVLPATQSMSSGGSRRR